MISAISLYEKSSRSASTTANLKSGGTAARARSTSVDTIRPSSAVSESRPSPPAPLRNCSRFADDDSASVITTCSRSRSRYWLQKTLVRMRNSHALQLVPASKVSKNR